MGLEYEGNFAAPGAERPAGGFARYLATPAEGDRQEHMRLYLHDNPHVRWGQDYTAWLLGRNCWVFALTDPQGMFEYGVGIEDVLALLKGLPGGRRLVIHVHPCYYGFRTAEDQDPLPWEKACCGATAPLVSQLDLANIKCDLAPRSAAGGLFSPAWRNSKPAWRGSSGSWRKSASMRGRTTASSTPPESENWGNTFFDAAQTAARWIMGLRILHIGNIAGNAYNIAKALRQRSDVEADVFTHDYRYYISDPEWEDGDIEPVRFDDPTSRLVRGRPEGLSPSGVVRRAAGRDWPGGACGTCRPRTCCAWWTTGCFAARGGGVAAAARRRAVCGSFRRAASRPVRRTGGGLSQNADGARLAALVHRAIPKNPRRVVCAAGREGTRAVRPRRRQDGLAVLPLRHHPGLRRLGADVAAAACPVRPPRDVRARLDAGASIPRRYAGKTPGVGLQNVAAEHHHQRRRDPRHPAAGAGQLHVHSTPRRRREVPALRLAVAAAALGGARLPAHFFAVARHNWAIKGNDKFIRGFALLRRRMGRGAKLFLADWGQEMERSRARCGNSSSTTRSSGCRRCRSAAWRNTSTPPTRSWTSSCSAASARRRPRRWPAPSPCSCTTSPRTTTGVSPSILPCSPRRARRNRRGAGADCSQSGGSGGNRPPLAGVVPPPSFARPGGPAAFGNLPGRRGFARGGPHTQGVCRAKGIYRPARPADVVAVVRSSSPLLIDGQPTALREICGAPAIRILADRLRKVPQIRRTVLVLDKSEPRTMAAAKNSAGASCEEQTPRGRRRDAGSPGAVQAGGAFSLQSPFVDPETTARCSTTAARFPCCGWSRDGISAPRW